MKLGHTSSTSAFCLLPPSNGYRRPVTVHKVLDGRYELSGLLGVGGSGEIHDGWDTRLHRPVAVKLLGREVCSRPDVRRRFEVEARAPRP